MSSVSCAVALLALSRPALAQEPRAEPAPERAKFKVDPIVDGALIAGAFVFGSVLEMVKSTGEIRPQQIAPDFKVDDLLGIDQGAVTSAPDEGATQRSNIAMGAVAAFALIDPVLSGFREKSVQTGVVDGVLYLESMTITFALTDLAKMAVRRPRPLAYAEAELHKDDPNYSNSSTDSALSFFSSHAAMSATIGATATYLAFARSPHTARPWITLTLAAAATTFISIERVRAGKHFPTDVIAGAVVGAGVGTLVPHLHREDDLAQRRVWVGFAPSNGLDLSEGGTLQLTGVF